jgi:hypothetical protein
MSNGIDKNPLLDISRVYLEQISEKKDDSYLEPDMKKRQKNNEKARKELAKGPQMKNPHFEEKQQEWNSEIVNSLAGAYKAMQEEGYGAPGHNPGSGEKSVARAKALMDKKGQKGAPGLDAMRAANKEHEARRGVKKEELEHLDEVSDRKVRAVRDAREKQWNKQFGKNRVKDPTDDMTDKVDKLIDQRNKRTGSKVKKTTMGQLTDKHRKEELELDENRRAARAAGGYKDDSKKQNDPSKAGFTGVGNMSIDQIRKMSARMDKEKTQKEGLDPVGQEDGDIDNDGDKDKSDKYLAKRRKAIGNAIKGKMKKEETDVDKYIETVAKVKEVERKNDIQRWVQKESRTSNWRQDLSEIMTDDVDSKPIKEKNVKNKIKINPKLGEAVEEIGGKILEMAEVKEGDGDPCWDSHKQVGMKKKGGKMVPNCVPKNEEVEVEEGMKPLPKNKMFRKAGNLGRDVVSPSVTDDQRQKAYDRSKKIVKTLNKANEEVEAEGYVPMDSAKKEKIDRQSNKAYAKEVVAARHGKSKEANKQMQRRIAMKDPAGRKASLKKEEASMTPQELQLQKRKAMLDRMIAQKRQQGLNKAKKSEPPTKAMGEEAECAHSMKGKECPIHGKKDCSSMKEATEDSLKDRRMERGGVGGNQRYNKPVSNTPNTFGKKKPYDGMSALEKVKASIRAKHGQGAIMDTKKK